MTRATSGPREPAGPLLFAADKLEGLRNTVRHAWRTKLDKVPSEVDSEDKRHGRMLLEHGVPFNLYYHHLLLLLAGLEASGS